MAKCYCWKCRVRRGETCGCFKCRKKRAAAEIASMQRSTDYLIEQIENGTAPPPEPFWTGERIGSAAGTVLGLKLGGGPLVTVPLRKMGGAIGKLFDEK